mgnify:CR=1 FL=1|tara:strand:- start:393 stop:617 length:225 start_codon:yes stop_codon:yes gene_type:complete
MRGEEFGVGFGKSQGGGIFDQDPFETGTRKLVKSIATMVCEQVADHLEKECDGELIEALVDGLFGHPKSGQAAE